MKTKLYIKRNAYKGVEDLSLNFQIDKKTFPLQLNGNDRNLLLYLLEEDELFKNSGEIETDLIIEKKSFIDHDNDGEEIQYLCYMFSCGGADFKVKPRQEDKRLLSFLLRNI